MITVGSLVRILPPFAIAYPGVYEVSGINDANGAFVVDGIGDFDPKFLELA